MRNTNDRDFTYTESFERTDGSCQLTINRWVQPGNDALLLELTHRTAQCRAESFDIAIPVTVIPELIAWLSTYVPDGDK